MKLLYRLILAVILKLIIFLYGQKFSRINVIFGANSVKTFLKQVLAFTHYIINAFGKTNVHIYFVTAIKFKVEKLGSSSIELQSGSK